MKAESNSRARGAAPLGSAAAKKAGRAGNRRPAANPSGANGKLKNHVDEVVRLNGQGVMAEEIGQRLGCHKNSIYQLLKKLGIKPQGRSARPQTRYQRHWARRKSECIYCGALFKTDMLSQACADCITKRNEYLTIWDRERGDDISTLPRNLRRDYLSG
jgi:hypothetical protein